MTKKRAFGAPSCVVCALLYLSLTLTEKILRIFADRLTLCPVWPYNPHHDARLVVLRAETLLTHVDVIFSNPRDQFSVTLTCHVIGFGGRTTTTLMLGRARVALVRCARFFFPLPWCSF